jgi:hypothetical protein
MRLKRRELACICVIISLSVGLVIGYYIPRDVRIQVIDVSGKYVYYHAIMKENLFPFSEADNVSVSISGHIMKINHTVPNNMGIVYFNIGFDNNWFVVWINQLRDSDGR